MSSSPPYGPADFYKSGDWNATCYICGRKFKASEMKQNWEGFYTCAKDWTPRQPQDFARGVPDTQNPPWTQPMPEDTFVAGSPGPFDPFDPNTEVP